MADTVTTDPIRLSQSRRATGRFGTPDQVRAGDAVVVAASSADDVLERAAGSSSDLDLAAALRLVGFNGKPGTTARILDGDRTLTVVGVPADAPAPVLAFLVAAGVRASVGATRVVVDVPLADADAARLVYRSALLATYRFDRYKAAETTEVDEVVVIGSAPEDLESLDALVDATCLARDITSLPAADKTPAVLADLLEGLASRCGAEFRRYEEAELRELGMNGLLAVGEASVHRPVLVRLGTPGTGEGRVAVVGKGVTYDAGGLNLKLAMLEMMKLDVGGAAAAAAAVLHAARFPREQGLTVWIGLCENVLSGSAYRGGDVITMHDGTTVEVTNTDAEGRITLADAMSLARADEPQRLITIATLTGAAMMALGMRTAALMTSDDSFAEAVLGASDRAGEDVWRMPVRLHFAESLASEIADVNNLGDMVRGQAMVAAAFLARFAPEGTPYAHLDIAGPAYNPGKPYASVPHGGTGFGVATLLELLG